MKSLKQRRILLIGAIITALIATIVTYNILKAKSYAAAIKECPECGEAVEYTGISFLSHVPECTSDSCAWIGGTEYTEDHSWNFSTSKCEICNSTIGFEYYKDGESVGYQNAQTSDQHQAIVDGSYEGEIEDHTFEAGACKCGVVESSSGGTSGGSSTTCEHTGGTHANGGKCTKCSTVYQTNHNPWVAGGTRIDENRKPTAEGHYFEALCYDCKNILGIDTWIDVDDIVKHSGATHANGGICTKCDYQYEKHEQEEEAYEYKDNGDVHNAWYYCTFDGCDEIFKETDVEHTFKNGVCKCGAEEEEDDGGCEHTYDWVSTGLSEHIKKCTKCGLTKGSAEDHDFSDYYKVSDEKHQEICVVCGASQVVSHDFDANGECPCGADMSSSDCPHTTFIDEYNANSHWEECEECGDKKNIEEHTYKDYEDNGDGTHSSKCTGCEYEVTGGHNWSNGKCEDCDAKECEHDNSDYEFDETYHWLVCEDCGVEIEGSEDEHTWVSGKCRYCDATKEEACNHTYKTKYDDTYHWEECTKTGCGEIKSGSKEKHKGATHANGGTCTVCDKKYETHGTSTVVVDYEESGKGHIEIYKCTNSNCTQTIKGTTIKEHTIGTATNNGDGTHIAICTACNAPVQTEHEYVNGTCKYCDAKQVITPGHEHSYTLKSNSTYHWKECSCGDTIEREAHKGATHANGGKCTVCNEQYEIHGTSTVVAKHEKSGTGHIAIYKCTNSNCTQTIKGTAVEEHTLGTATNNGNGTHTGTCTKCSEEVTENHNYENGECKDCGVKVECEHTYVQKSDNTYHWKACSKCNNVDSSTKEAHKITTWTNKENGTHTGTCTECNKLVTENHTIQNKACTKCSYKETSSGSSSGSGDSTTSGKDLPNTGKETVIIGAIALIGIAAISYVAYKRNNIV